MANKVKEDPRESKRRKPQRPREPGKTTISSKNQITLPVEAMRAAGFEPGTRLEVKVMHGGNLVLSDASTTRLEKLERGAGLFNGLYPPGYLEELRKDEP
jgi:bifunctional DNA-binding transcriptional regulator/antitoxin component of YhaV-PrlF toxin-antitoxin module